MLQKIQEASEFILTKLKGTQPTIAVILGSGLGNFANKIENQIIVPYKTIPHFPISTVEGHEGNLICGNIGDKTILVMQGRFHYYEGYSMNQVTFPVRVMKMLNIDYLLVSNAAGGLNPKYKTGDLMIIEDHINFFPENPLRGKNIDELGPRFPDMSKTYNAALIEKAVAIGKNENIQLQKGIYIGSSGPTLETPAEYRLFRQFGADATGMSTIPEIIVAHHMGLKCFGVSVITNESTPPSPDSITTHEEVNTNAASAEPRLTKLFSNLIKEI